MHEIQPAWVDVGECCSEAGSTPVVTHGRVGQVRPSEVFNGGDPTGLVTSITWRGWGGAQAVGTGRGLHVGPGQSVAQGTIEPVRIVAFDLGTCNGRYMYAAVEWYFPQHKQAFDAGQFEDAGLHTSPVTIA